MRNIYLFFVGSILMTLASCTQTEVPAVCDKSNSSIEELYLEFNRDIQQELSNQLCQLGFQTSRFSSDESLVGQVLQMSEEELRSLVNNEHKAKVQSRQDSIMSNFFLYYSDEDYVLLKKDLDSYIFGGGHNMSLIEEITKDLPKNLVNGSLYMFATADNLASKEIWNWLDEPILAENTLQISLYQDNSQVEFYCRQAFWDKIRLIALGAGSEYLAGSVCGPFMPEADALVTAANLLGAGDAAYEYFACCHHAIT